MTTLVPYIHGSSDAQEVERLERQARYVAPRILDGFGARPGDRVLDLGTGVGAMAHQLLRRFPGIVLVGADLRESQLAHARQNHPGAQYVQADATALPFPDQSFQRVHASWLLEHVPEPERVVREVWRVLQPGGQVQFSEVDNSTFSLQPPNPELNFLLDAMNRVQQAAGGDPFIGPKLEGIFRRGGFKQIHVDLIPFGGDRSERAEMEALAEDTALMLESADESLGAELVPRLFAGAAALRALSAQSGAGLRLTATRLRAIR